MRALRPRDVAPDELDAPFWQAARERRFLVQRCTACDRAYWPAGCCVEHGRATMEWREASGRGRVHTYTIVHHPYEPSLAAKVPYALAVVELDEGPFFHSDIVRCDPNEVHVGMRVEVVWDALDAEDVIPRFAPEAHSEEEKK
jgi:uncharacterized OB-fold protein